jgi:polyisoprenoid-binding protein YceI
MRLTFVCVSIAILLWPTSRGSTKEGAPVFKITPAESSVRFEVEASIDIKGNFDKWDATLTFSSPEVSSGVLDIKIQADSVDTGSGI